MDNIRPSALLQSKPWREGERGNEKYAEMQMKRSQPAFILLWIYRKYCWDRRMLNSTKQRGAGEELWRHPRVITESFNATSSARVGDSSISRFGQILPFNTRRRRTIYDYSQLNAKVVVEIQCRGPRVGPQSPKD